MDDVDLMSTAAAVHADYVPDLIFVNHSLSRAQRHHIERHFSEKLERHIECLDRDRVILEIFC